MCSSRNTSAVAHTNRARAQRAHKRRRKHMHECRIDALQTARDGGAGGPAPRPISWEAWAFTTHSSPATAGFPTPKESPDHGLRPATHPSSRLLGGPRVGPSRPLSGLEGITAQALICGQPERENACSHGPDQNEKIAGVHRVLMSTQTPSFGTWHGVTPSLKISSSHLQIASTVSCPKALPETTTIRSVPAFNQPPAC